MRYGFIGPGNLGAKLASSLVRAGFDMTVNDLDLEDVLHTELRAPGFPAEL